MRIIRNIARTLVYITIVFKLYEWMSYLRFRGRISDARKRGNLRLQLGSGTHDVSGWVSIDMLIRENILAMRLPGGLRRFPDESVQYIYSSHFLEHIEYPGQANEFARQCHRILKPGGVIRIVVPGIEKIIRAYATDNDEFFRLQSEMHPDWCTTKLDHLMYALQQNGQHKYGYDLETIAKLLSDAGFTNVVESNFNASSVDELNIDYRGKTDESGSYLSLYVDAFK